MYITKIDLRLFIFAWPLGPASLSFEIAKRRIRVSIFYRRYAKFREHVAYYTLYYVFNFKI